MTVRLNTAFRFTLEKPIMSYAVIRTGGKQYRVAPGDVIRVEKLPQQKGSSVEFDEVLIASDGETVQVGKPLVDGARVTAEVEQQGRGKKILVFKKKRRKNYRRHHGHRQAFTAVRVTGVETGAAKSEAGHGA
jgi:large subunit ribosomal protein L21